MTTEDTLTEQSRKFDAAIYELGAAIMAKAAEIARLRASARACREFLLHGPQPIEVRLATIDTLLAGIDAALNRDEP